ncbi:hypothetical protein [Salinicoccus sp. YB14-2]|uniref:hypothetical protein n=1 Tax=Salinicoccus sp. YB14-2 TaxID=1572701 RepID=UPI0012E25F9F|nr:hypothetical protein [Salinicoccus sp. YB14-2]
MMKIKVKRPLSLLDSWIPLTVKLKDQNVGAVRNGDETVISMPEDHSELSVAYLHDRSERIPVEAGDVITVKQNKTSHFLILAMFIAVLIPLIALLAGQNILPYLWVIMAVVVIILAISLIMKSYDIERTGQLTEEALTEDEDVEGVHVRRTNSYFESALPLSVKLNEEEKEKLKGGEQTVIPMKEDEAERSVEFLYEAGNRVKVEKGDVVSIKRNWIFKLGLIIFVLVLIGPGILSILGAGLNFAPAVYGIVIAAVIVAVVAITMMKSDKVEVVEKAH